MRRLCPYHFGLSLAPPKWHKAGPAHKEAGSQRGAKAGGEDEVYKGHFPGQAGRLDKMRECRTTQDGPSSPLVNGRE